MTTRERTSPQIRPYLDVLETRLGNLSIDERAELLNDLEDHLEEILVDDSHEPLSDRIGSPDAYAEEFVASVGISDGTVGDRSLIEMISDAVRRIAQHIDSSRASDIWEEMRPAWWTIRGLAIGLLLTWNYLGPGDPEALLVMRIVSGVTLIGLIWLSMRLGRNRARSTAWKWLSIAVTLIGISAMLALSANISARLDPNVYGQYGPHPTSDDSGPYPYGSLTDQDVQFMSETGMTPQEYFDSGYFQDLREGEFVPPLTKDPFEPPVIVTP